MNQSLFGFHRHLLASLLFLTLGVSCGKKARIEYETAQVKLSLTEQTAAFKKLQAESLALGNLGYYNQPTPALIDQLKAKVKSLRQETENLKQEKEASIQDTVSLQKEIDSYRSRHSR